MAGERVVVLGAGYAGVSAAVRLSRRRDPAAAQITVVNQRPDFVERIRLHQVAAGQRRAVRPLARLRARSISVIVGRVESFDVDTQSITLASGAAMPYDRMVVALGSSAAPPPVHVDGDVHAVASLDQAERLRARCAELPSDGVVTVVGGGLTGTELAGELAATLGSTPAGRSRVRLITQGDLGPWLQPRLRTQLRKRLRRMGIDVIEGTTVTGAADGLVATDSGEMRSDVTVWTTGFAVPAIVAGSGLAAADDGRMLVDGDLRSVSHPNVHGAGDVAVLADADVVPVRMACQTAIPMGWHVGDAVGRDLAHRPSTPFRMRYVWTNLSLGRRDGITQFTRTDDTPLPVSMTGRRAAVFKELISRGAMRSTGL